MVEKSGFLSGDLTAPPDIDALTSLIDSISDITQRLSPSRVQNAPNNDTVNQLTAEPVGQNTIQLVKPDDVQSSSSNDVLQAPTFEAGIQTNQLGSLPSRPLEQTFGLNAFEIRPVKNSPLAAASSTIFDPDASRQRLEGMFSNVHAVIKNAQRDVMGDVIFGTNRETAITGLSPGSIRGLTIFGEVPAVESVPTTPRSSFLGKHFLFYAYRWLTRTRTKQSHMI